MYVFLKPFKWQVWLAVGISIPLIATVLSAITKISTNSTMENANCNLLEYLFHLYSLTVKQGTIPNILKFKYWKCSRVKKLEDLSLPVARQEDTVLGAMLPSCTMGHKVLYPEFNPLSSCHYIMEDVSFIAYQEYVLQEKSKVRCTSPPRSLWSPTQWPSPHPPEGPRPGVGRLYRDDRDT